MTDFQFKSNSGIHGPYSILSFNATPATYTIAGDLLDEGIDLCMSADEKYVVIDSVTEFPE